MPWSVVFRLLLLAVVMRLSQQPGAQLGHVVGVESRNLVRRPAVALGELDLELKRADRLAPFFVGVL
jgi:hypothetical protein